MKIRSIFFRLLLAGCIINQSCTQEEKKEETQEQQEPEIKKTNNDLEYATELFLSNPVIDSTWLIDSSNYGPGQQEFNPDSASVRHTFAQEENTDWYKFVGSADTSLAITVEPNDPAAEYDLLVFKATENVAGDLKGGLIPAIRSNFAKRSLPEDTITGFHCNYRLSHHVPADSTQQFSEAFWMQKGETYYLVLNTPTGGGKGYKLRMHSCAPGTGGMGPKMISFSPSKGKKGTTVTISGNGFSGSSSVSFGGTDALSFIVINNQTIKAVVGDGSSGEVQVRTGMGTVSKDGFSYIEGGKGTKSTVLPSENKPKPFVKRKKSNDDNGDYYIVKPKDTMFSIAYIFGMTVEEIKKLNNLSSTDVYVGQKLKVIRRSLKPQKNTAPVKKPEVGKKPADKPVNQQVQKPSGDKPGNPDQPVQPEKPAVPVETMVNKTAGFNQTPAMPKEKVGLSTTTENENSLAAADKSFYLYCNVTSSVTKLPVAGTLQVVDLKKKNLVFNIQANKTQKVPLYNEGGRQKLVIADIFGYRKQDFDLNLDNIINDSTAGQVTIVDDTIVINLEMQRLKKNDVAVAYNIFFYDDASVMLPKSTYELDQLLELMNENKNIKIKIHGHTNTSKLGKILYLEKGDPNFFRLTARNKETFGTAAQLSKKRAETIRYYLLSKRIAENRVETEGHGGSQMLYPNTHPLAFKNKRVEIEILAD